jgi:hypothetical protein
MPEILGGQPRPDRTFVEVAAHIMSGYLDEGPVGPWLATQDLGHWQSGRLVIDGRTTTAVTTWPQVASAKPRTRPSRTMPVARIWSST